VPNLPPFGPTCEGDAADTWAYYVPTLTSRGGPGTPYPYPYPRRVTTAGTGGHGGAVTVPIHKRQQCLPTTRSLEQRP